MHNESPQKLTKDTSETISFHTNNDPTKDKVSKVKIIDQGEKLGDGRFSKSVEIVSAVVLDDKGNESSPHSFVLKKFTFPYDWDWSKGKPAENALISFNLLKKHKIKTWTTYRLSEDKESILMTNGNMDGKTLLTANKNTSLAAKNLERNPIKKIENFEPFIAELFAEAKKAEEEKIYLHTDAYGFFVDNSSITSGNSNFDFIISDLDNVEFGETQSRQYEINLQQAFEAMKIVVGTYVDASHAYDYIRSANKYLSEKYGFRVYGL